MPDFNSAEYQWDSENSRQRKAERIHFGRFILDRTDEIDPVRGS
jgi:hypothetical protein